MIAEVLGTIRTYDDLHALLRARAEQLELSRETIDYIAGLTGGYTSKLLAPVPIKKLGKVSFDAMLGALGLQLVAIEDPSRMARILDQPKRDTQMARIANHCRRKGTRRARARHAAAVRWGKK